MLISTNSEIVLDAVGYQGLLFRATELLCEQRQLELVSGYGARTDYVSHFAMECAVSLSAVAESSEAIDTLRDLNGACNHALNLSCTVADAGLMSAILGCFELREVAAESIERTLGARLHANLSQVTNILTLPHAMYATLAEFSVVTLDMLLTAVVSCRLNRSRLIGVHSVAGNSGYTEVVTGPLLEASGWADSGTADALAGESSSRQAVYAGIRSCSLVRHVLRTRLAVTGSVSLLHLRHPPEFLRGALLGYKHPKWFFRIFFSKNDNSDVSHLNG